MRSFLRAGLLAGFALALLGCGDPPPPPAVCGDGTVDAGEVCDDGNTADDDGCSAACDSDESCGNGVLDDALAFPEQCDDGNLVNGDGCDDFCFIETECGNGFLDANEECDDGNLVNGDGCEDDCTINLAAVCAADVIANLGDNAGDIANGSDVLEPLDGDCTFGAPGQEIVFTFTPAASGTATVTITPDANSGLDPALYARTSCEDINSELACADVGLGDDPETITFAVTANTAVTIIADSFNATGTFVLNIAVQ
jgi:cysteine-rich repeat protein